MFRLPGDDTAFKDSSNEVKISNQVVVGSIFTFGIIVLAITAIPHALQQFGVKIIQ